MNIFKVSTTAYKEEDFYLLTNLSREQIESTIEPIIESSRRNDEWYDNETLYDELRDRYSGHVVKLIDNIETITL